MTEQFKLSMGGQGQLRVSRKAEPSDASRVTQWSSESLTEPGGPISKVARSRGWTGVAAAVSSREHLPAGGLPS